MKPFYRLVMVGFGLLHSFAQGADLQPNEMGQIMVLEYHQIGPGEDRWRRTPENFKADLQALYERGYYLTSLNDILDGKIKVPRGRTPVVLTFDDAAVGQFGYLNSKNGKILDPLTAAGMIKEFSDLHPDFGRAATFFLNPDKKRSTVWSEILQEMVSLGFELGNHTVNHPKLNLLNREQVEAEIAGCQAWINRNVPGYLIRSLALPFGIYPRQGDRKMEDWAIHGESRGVQYHHDALLEVGSNPSPSPFSIHFRPAHIPRVQVWGLAKPGEPVFSRFLKEFDAHPERRFVSDGDPETVTIPRGQKRFLNLSKIEGMNLIER